MSHRSRTRRLALLAACLPAVLLVHVAASTQSRPAPYDILITGGRIVDGTGAPWVGADLGIYGDRIRAIGDLANLPATLRIDASGLVVAPGFIDLLGQSEFNVLVDGRAASKIMQGITTEVTGEGSSIAPLNDRMIQAAKAGWDHFGVVADFRPWPGISSASRHARSPPSTSRRSSARAACATTSSAGRTARLRPTNWRRWGASSRRPWKKARSV